MKALKWIALGVGGVLVLVAALLAWALMSESGARWIASTVSNALGAKLEIGGVQGTIAGPLTIIDLRYLDPLVGVEATVDRIELDLELRSIIRPAAHVRRLAMSGVDVLLGDGEPKPPPEEDKPFTLDPPLDVIIDALHVADLRIRSDEATVFEATRAAFAGHWTSEDLAVEQLDLRSPQGEVHFDGRVRSSRQPASSGVGPHVYVGEGRGQFRWTLGERTFAGTLNTTAEGKDANVAMRLTSPLAARIELLLEQTDALPWRFTLEAPRFDPREELMPGSSLEALAATLNGEGTLERGTVRGKLLVNDESIVLEPLTFERGAEHLALAGALRIAESPGLVHANATINLAQTPAFTDATARWSDLVIPAVWAGQELHSRGRLDFSGNAERYAAEGRLSIGPVERIADIALQLEGSPDEIRLGRFDIIQSQGKLAANGSVQLKPRLAWRIDATAQHFDPGAFAPAWRGSLDFRLASRGRMMEKGPDATVMLSDLGGELRGRRLSGAADLALSPALVPSGTLALASGDSELEFRGARGDAIDAQLSLDVASLNDWIPDGGGELQAAFVVRGKWPELSIEGDARGRDLHAANVRAQSLAIDADVEDPRNPKGGVQLNVQTLSAAGFEFATLTARASGGPAEHKLALQATGAPLAFALTLEGARTEQGWTGSLQQLDFDVADAAQLELRAPVNITAEGGAFEMSQMCLIDGRIEVCARGGAQADGAMQASYSLQNVPLGLANVFASGETPLRFAGVVNGRGDVRRTREGELHGQALVEAPSGRVARHIIEAEGETEEKEQVLLTWRDVRLAATLSGADARGSLDARINENGTIDAEGSVRGLGQSESPVRARLTAALPDLAPLAVFAPQVANVHGRADARFDVAGTLQAPQLTGELRASELAADVPAVGLHLKGGRIVASPAEGGAIALSGGVASGDGSVAFAGQITQNGALDVTITGDRFLAADFPAARVIANPDLRFIRADERMRLTGKVTIPEADVNLQKLPRGGENAQEASPDVVVIDAKTREDEAAEAPLFAEVTVILGEDVELTGFGLQAQVQGRLDVRESPGEPTLGSGEVRVAGRYKAYGQDLTIQEGRLLYASTPLDDPRLNIEATRQVEEVTAGLRVRGSAKNPELTVFSDPPMAQANALSYLVAGKPLDAIGADEGEGDALQTATRSLGTAAGGLLAKTLGKRLGVDELAVKDDEMIGGAALTVGQYLSPRLYLSYGVGLFEPGEVVTLRYKLSDDFDVKAQVGPEDTRTGIEYRIER